jgi:DNA-binding protein HU-beta
LTVKVGDTIVMRAKTKRLAPAARTGVVEEVLDAAQPRLLVRWSDGRATVIAPLPDAFRIEQPRSRRKAAAARTTAAKTASRKATPAKAASKQATPAKAASKQATPAKAASKKAGAAAAATKKAATAKAPAKKAPARRARKTAS